MKKALLLIALVLVSCSKDFKSEMKDSVKIYVSNAYGANVNVSEFNITKIDTITQEKRYDIASTVLYSKLQTQKEGYNVMKDAFESASEIYSSDQSNEEYKAHYEETKEEYNKIEKIIRPMVDRLDALAKKQSSVDKNKFLAYDVRGTIKYVTSENVEKTDSIYLIVNKDLKIIEKPDFVKDLIN